jgi:uncharacterized Zn-finger protein
VKSAYFCSECSYLFSKLFFINVHKTPLTNLNLEYRRKQAIMTVFQKKSKTEMNLEYLKDYPYSTEEGTDEQNKPLTVYKCGFEGCTKEFNRTWSILDHVRAHRGVKPFVCEFCNKGFTQKGNMRKHLKQHLAPTLDQRKRYVCKICNRRYTEKYNFKVSHSSLLLLTNYKATV